MSTLLAAATVASLAVSAAADATPGDGDTSTEFLAFATLPDRLDVNEHFPNGSKIRLKTNGPVNVVTMQRTMDAGASTGWHSHEGVAILSVMSGTVTVYEAERRRCVPTTLTGGDVMRGVPGDAMLEATTPHLLRNETDQPVAYMITWLLPPNSTPTVDEEAPAGCPGIS